MGTSFFTSLVNGYGQGMGYRPQLRAYKVDGNGFYPADNSSENGKELFVNTISVNLTVAGAGVKIPLSPNSAINNVGNFAIKAGVKKGVVHSLESALSIH